LEYQDENLVPLTGSMRYCRERYDDYNVQDSNTTQAQKMELKNNEKKDTNALFYIQQVLNESLFPRIMEEGRQKKSW